MIELVVWPKSDEPVDHLLEVGDVAHVERHDEAVLAGDPVALDDLRRLARELGDLRELTAARPDA